MSTSTSSRDTASSSPTASGVMVISEALSSTRFWPSGDAPATSWVARAPLAPGLFTTGIGTPRSSAAASDTARAMRSVDPPAAWPTVRVMGSVGKSAPEALLPPPTLPPHALSARSEVAAVTPTSAVRNEVFFMGSPEGVRDRNRPTGAREDSHPCEWHHKRIGSRA